MLEDADPGGMQPRLADQITGFESAAALGAFVFGFNLLNVILFVAITAYQLHTQRDTQSLRLVQGSCLPELTLKPGMRFHLFLSHIWSSGHIT